MAEKLWNIGDHEHPVIQGQAGKPFSGHQQKDLYFSDSNIVQNNDCQCHYRSYNYYAVFAYIPQEKSTRKVFAEGWNEPDSNSFISYAQQERDVYHWEILGDPVPIGCHEKDTFVTGVWLPFNLPYNKYQKKDALHWGNFHIEHICPWSLRVMYVNSMQCCNGEQGCGHQVIPQDTQAKYCTRRYHVTGLDTQEPLVFPIGKPICGIRKPHQNFQQLTCGSCQLTVWAQMEDFSNSWGWDESNSTSVLLSTACQNCIQSLPQKALQTASQKIDRRCVYWRLYKKESSYWQTDKKQTWVEVIDKGDLEDFIWGLGNGWLHSTAHDTKPHVTCDDGKASLYMWTSVNEQIELNLPQWPYESDNIEPCYSSCPPQEESQQDTDDQPPCNSPDAPPYMYDQFTHNKFTLWSRTYRRDAAIDTDGGNGAASWYPDGDFENQGQYTDWELYLDNWLDPVTREFNGSSIQPACGELQVTRYYISAEGEGFCGAAYDNIVQDCSQETQYYQVYFTGKNRQQITPAYSEPYPEVTSFRTWKWYPLQKMSQQEMALRGIVPGVWQKKTQLNVAKGIDASQVVAVYTSDTCGDWPEVPKKKVFTWWRTVEPVFKSDCNYDHSVFSQWQLIQEEAQWTKNVFMWDGVGNFIQHQFPETLIKFTQDHFVPCGAVGASQYQYVCSATQAQRFIIDDVFADETGEFPVITAPAAPDYNTDCGLFNKVGKNCQRSFYTVFYLVLDPQEHWCSKMIYCADLPWHVGESAQIPTYSDPEDYTGIYYDKDKNLQGVVSGYRTSYTAQDGFGNQIDAQYYIQNTVYYIYIRISCGNQPDTAQPDWKVVHNVSVR